MYLYIGMKILNMSPSYFWKCTPRKFDALCQIHAKLNMPEQGSSGGIGEPEAFIDQIL